VDFPEAIVESHRINIRIELTLNPSLRKRGTYTPSLLKRRGSGDEFNMTHPVK